MSLSIIAAIGKNNELGKNNTLIWYLPSDLRFFKEMTNGKVIIMGRKTFESIGIILPNRKHIIITSKDLNISGDVEIYKTIEEILKKYLNDKKENFVIGGVSIYNQLLDYANTMYLTEINDICREADAYFPNFDKSLWKRELLNDTNENGISYQHVKYIKK